MNLTQTQTDNILKKLRDYKIYCIDIENSSILNGVEIVSEEYFNEKINEALEE